MKKILIVNNNMKLGGVQVSLINLLWQIKDRYDVTLYLFDRNGANMDQIPAGVTMRTCTGPFRFFGVSQGECKGLAAWKRGALAVACRLFGRTAVVRWMLPWQKNLPEIYDCAIAFLQNGRESNFYGGVQDFVIHCVDASKKVAFMHGDYSRCGANEIQNHRLLGCFDRIAACSQGCREAFCQTVPALAEKCVTVCNCHRFEQIRMLAEQSPVEYEAGEANVVMVARLTHEKGIERAIEAVAYGKAKGLPVKLHIVGGGPMRQQLEQKAKALDVEEQVCFYGEQANPYRFVKQADLLLIASFHEAAPVVIGEAACLGVPTLTVRTTSSDEMVTQAQCGWVCENDQHALNETLARVLAEPEELAQCKAALRCRDFSNETAMSQFTCLIEEL